MNHVLLGAALPLLVCAVIYAARGGRASGRLLVLGPLAMLLSGAWAVFPDLPRMLGDNHRYFVWHTSSWCNLCWGHCFYDAHPEVEDWPGWTVIAIVVGAAVLAVAYRELRRAEREATWRT